jgi:hypothetical protein
LQRKTGIEALKSSQILAAEPVAGLVNGPRSELSSLPSARESVEEDTCFVAAAGIEAGPLFPLWCGTPVSCEKAPGFREVFTSEPFPGVFTSSGVTISAEKIDPPSHLTRPSKK